MVDSTGPTDTGLLLLETKLYIPKWRAGLVSRPRLIDRMRRGIGRKLTLISAPAGFGKTTMLAEWVAAAGERPVAWVSLEHGDNDPTFFWTYFINALQKVRPGLGARALALLHSPQPPPMDSVVATLINEIHAVEGDFTMILDDYHTIDAKPVHQAMDLLLDHLPSPMHLIIASRSDPPLPLARLRARGELTELRVAELSFTPGEAAAFLNEVMGLALSADDVAALEKRTEGWIAGLQLAALSMQGRRDMHGFVEAFSGDDRYIVDYLVEEVLQRQPEEVRDFLLQTAILDRLSDPLCDAVTARKNGKMLENLERGNLFVVPLDDKRQWYRYHHLFADVLLAHAVQEQPDHIPALHRRASDWYRQNGQPTDAIRHALAAEDFARAAELIELAWPAMRRSRQEATIHGWIKTLPDKLIRTRPVLCVANALTLLDNGELDAAEARLRDAERWLQTDDTATQSKKSTPDPYDAGMLVVDQEQYRSLPASIANARAYRAMALGDVPATVKHTRRALELLQQGDDYERGTTAALLGLAYWASGDLEQAYNSFADGLTHLQKAGGIVIRTGGALILANIRIAQGRLIEATGIYEQTLKLANEQGQLPGTADLHMGLSDLYRERGELEAAEQQLLHGEALGEQATLPGSEYLWCIAWARIKQARGDLDSALELIHKAEQRYYNSPAPNVRPIPAIKARLWLAQGRLAEAENWARQRGLSTDDELSYLHEYEHITLVRILLARYTNDQDDGAMQQATALLQRLLQAAEQGNRMGSVIEILILQSLAHGARTDIPQALEYLQRALTMAEPEGYFRIFVDEGQAMRELLRRAAAGIAGAYTGRLLSAFDQTAAPATAAETAPLPEPLTAREVEILRLIAAGMRNQEIADQLFISLSTVKRHIANAYGKLGVGHRTEAVAKANELKLL